MLYPSAPKEPNTDVEKRSEKEATKILVNTLLTILKRNLPNLEVKIIKQKNFENFKVLSTLMRTIDTFVVYATTSASLTLFSTGFELIVKRTFIGTICGLTLGI